MTSVLRAGAGRAEMDLADTLPVDGFDPLVLHALQARALVLEVGRRRVALLALELTSLPDWAIERYRALASALLDMAADHVLVGVSHTFSAPHLAADPPVQTGSPRGVSGLLDAVDGAVRKAVRLAQESLAPATIAFGHGACRLNVCRDVLTPQGWWLGQDDSGPTDDRLLVLRIDTPAGDPVALLTTYGVQASVLDGSRTADGQRPVSSDLFGAASRHVERSYGDRAVAIVLPAAAGDQAPILTAVRQETGADGRVTWLDTHEDGHRLVDVLGDRLGERIVRVAASAESVAVQPGELSVARRCVAVPAQVPPARREDLSPTHAFEFRPAPDSRTPVVVLRIGTVQVVGVRPELNAVTGHELLRRAGGQVMLATLIDGAAKYMADATSYDRATYEAMNSRYGRGAAELLVDAIDEVLNG